MSDYDLRRFPIGPCTPKPTLTAGEREGLIEEIQGFPSAFREMVEGLSETQLDTPYRDGGWTVRQVVHHVPDSHLQGYVKFKLALTEDRPTIKTYDQAAWVDCDEVRSAPVGISLDLLDGLHTRWTHFLRSLTEDDLSRSYIHPDAGEISLAATLQIYAWHGKHHLGHISLVAASDPAD